MSKGKAIDADTAASEEGGSDAAMAAEVAARAKARGASGRADHGLLTPAAKQTRDAAIMTGLYAGVEVRELAKQFGITPRSVRRIRENFEVRSTPLEARPMEIVERLLRTYEQQMHTFAMVAHDTLERAPAVAISALKAQAETLERYSLRLMEIGKLPDNLELFRSEGEMLRVGEQMVDYVERLAAGEVTAAEVREFFAALLLSRSRGVIEGREITEQAGE